MTPKVPGPRAICFALISPSSNRTPLRPGLLVILGWCACLLAQPPRSRAQIPAPTAAALTQPLGQNSTLIGENFVAGAAPKDGQNMVLDSTFANWIQGALINGGQSTVGDATFFFNQCFGGGFLDDLNNALGNTVNWVGGSASRFDQAAYGQLPGALNPNVPPAASSTSPNPMSYWTTQLAPLLVNNSVNANSIATATANDPWGPNGGRLEAGQLAYPAGKGGVNLTTAQNRYAILWAGYTDAPRHYNNTVAMYNALTGQGYQVFVLYGDGKNTLLGGNVALPVGWGAQAATPAMLQNTIQGVGTLIANDNKLGIMNDQFLFYATDHGGNTQVMGPGAGGGLIPGAGGPAGSYGTIRISGSEMLGITSDPTARATLTIEYSMSDSTDDAHVLFDGYNLGDIAYNSSNPSDAFATLQIPDADLAGTNDLSFQTVTGASFNVLNATFFSGAVEELAVPEPSAMALMGLGIIAAVCGARARRGWARFIPQGF